MNVTVDVDPSLINIDYSIYAYDFDLKSGIEIDKSKNDALTIPEYDNFIRSRNIHNNKLIKVDVTFIRPVETSRDLNIEICSKNTVVNEPFINGKDGTRTYNDTLGYKYKYDGSNYICNNISNVIQFKLASEQEIANYCSNLATPIEWDLTDPNVIYDSGTKFFNSDTAQTYVTNGAKEGSIEFTLTGVPANSNLYTFFIEYNYNDDLINSFLGNCEDFESIDHVGVEVLKENIVLNFYGDIELLRIEAPYNE